MAIFGRGYPIKPKFLRPIPGVVPENHTTTGNATARVFASGTSTTQRITNSSSVELTFTDDFNRADGAIGSNWTNLINELQVISNKAGSTTSREDVNVWAVQTNTNDNFSEATITPGGNFSVLCRVADSGNFIQFRYSSLGPIFGLHDEVGGVTQLAIDSVPGVPYVSGDVMRIEVVGNTVTGYINGIPLLSGTTTRTTGKSVGLRAYNNTTIRFDDWSGGDVASGSAGQIARVFASGTSSTQRITKSRLTFTDDFNRSDGALGANWTDITNGLQVVSNKAGSTVSQTDESVWASQTLLDNNFSEATVTTGNNFSVLCRVTDADNYLRFQYTSLATNLTLYERIGGLEGGPIDSMVLAWVTGWVMRVEVVGDTVKGYVNDTLILSATTTLMTGKSVGLRSYNNTLARFDDWSGGDLSGQIAKVFASGTSSHTEGTTSRMKYHNGSAYTAKPVKYHNGSTYVTKPVKYHNGSAWV